METKRQNVLAALKTLSSFLEPFLHIVNTHLVKKT